MSRAIKVARIRFCPMCGGRAPAHLVNGAMRCGGCGEVFKVVDVSPGATGKGMARLVSARLEEKCDDEVRRKPGFGNDEVRRKPGFGNETPR